MNFTRRVSRLESWMAPRRRPRVILRFEGPGSESLPQPDEEIDDDNNPVVVLRFVEAKDGRPVES